jgi:acetyl esterase
LTRASGGPYPFDPELVAAAAQFPARDLSDLQAARQARPMPPVDIPPGVSVVDHHIDVDGRADRLTVRVYRPVARPDPLPCVVTLHAGGFVLGSIEQDHRRNVGLCDAVEAVIVAVDYRLAPEHPYPAALDDASAALTWIRDHADELAVDAARIAVLGRSAGGGLAAAAALRARDRGGPDICFLHLSMPQLDDRLDTASSRQFTDTPMWNRRAAELSWAMYLGTGVPGTDKVDGYAAPGRADVRGLPPTYLSAMEFDPLRDEAIIFASALLEAGVPTEFHLLPGTFHGSAALVPAAAVSRRERAEEISVLRRQLGVSP